MIRVQAFVCAIIEV